MDFSYLKPGDTVVISPNGSSFSDYQRLYEFAEVLKVGKLKIETNKGNFKTSNGGRWGHSFYHSDRLSELPVQEAQKENDEARASNRILNLRRKLNDTKWREVPEEIIEQIAILLKLEKA